MRLLFGGITWFVVTAGAAVGAESGFFGCRPPAHHPPGDVRGADLWVRPLGSDAPDSHPGWIEGLDVVARVAFGAGIAWWAVQIRDDLGSLNGTDAIRVDPIEAGGAAVPIAIVSLSVTELR